MQTEAQSLADALARKAEAVRAMGMVDALAQRIGRLHDSSLAAQQQAAERGGVVMGITRAVRLAVQSGVMGLGAWLVLENELTPGAMLAASILVSKALAPVEQMVGAWRTVTSGRESWARLRELLAGDGGRRIRSPCPPPSAGSRSRRPWSAPRTAGRCCATSPSRSSPANASPSSAHRAPARARSAAC